MDGTTKQKISEEVEDLKNTIEQLDLTNIQKTTHTTKSEYIIYSRAYEIFSNINHVLSDRRKLARLK